jgi:hypothetical protein
MEKVKTRTEYEIRGDLYEETICLIGLLRFLTNAPLEEGEL